jgi:erythritol transport system ATP-binding protein
MPFWCSTQVRRRARPSKSFRKRRTTFQILFFHLSASRNEGNLEGENLSLASIGAFVKRLLLSRSGERALVDESIRDARIKTEGGSAPIGSLSGGNQQKVVIGKVLATRPRVILLDEPTRGIDIGAKAEIFRLLGERAAQGVAVVFSTSEVADCLSIAHRIIVMRRGRISAQFRSDVTKEEIMAASGEAVVGRSS